MTVAELQDILAGGLVLTGTYALVALAWVFVYRATGILNFATGSFAALGAFIFYSLNQQAGLAFGWALILTLLAVAVAGALVHFALLRPLAGQHVFSPIVVTIGLAIVLSSVMALIWGSGNKLLPGPVANSAHDVLPGLRLTTFGLAVMAAAGITVSLALLFLRFAKTGIQMRATAEKSLLASQRGINISLVFALAFAFAALTAALGGIGVAHLTVLSPALSTLGLRAIAPALIGGMDSVGGAIVGAFVVAFVETAAVTQWGGTVRDITVLSLLLVVLVIRPYGLFGTREIRRV
jgi:branched-chain amino acid transport system permease protein